jgi:hypothetical protein
MWNSTAHFAESAKSLAGPPETAFVNFAGVHIASLTSNYTVVPTAIAGGLRGSSPRAIYYEGRKNTLFIAFRESSDRGIGARPLAPHLEC